MITPTACVVGWPIAHSRSPLIHRHWLKSLSITGDYSAVPIEPDRIDAFFSEFADGGFVGGNVTVPYKEIAFKAVAEADETAGALRAVNTLWLDGQKLMGGNTDAHGFLANLDTGAPGWDQTGEAAIVLGAGGGASAVIWALLQRDVRPVVVVNRTLQRAERLAKMFAGDIRACDWRELSKWIPSARVLVNATSLGMTHQPPLDIDISALGDETIVSDLVYAPLETPLIRTARAQDLVAVGGLGMLLHQAAPGFEKWFGKRPEVTDQLFDLVAADLTSNA